MPDGLLPCGLVMEAEATLGVGLLAGIPLLPSASLRK